MKIARKTATTTGTLVTRMKAGDTFEFQSNVSSAAKRKENTGLYIRVNSKKAKALNLNNFKVYDFTSSETGTIVAATLSLD